MRKAAPGRGCRAGALLLLLLLLLKMLLLKMLLLMDSQRLRRWRQQKALDKVPVGHAEQGRCW